ncbi:cytochrome b [Sphingomonas kaistensis]|uniref:Cytochrome b n=1 Tax=Sphingomonas kaistensis TaxID=298708 RepID=A0A7X6BI39_9SPHN|nr:cytochrome b/b6 domain-containing protein [Sphingomonas kaistensis]NJC06756.1 cytochrome b [Sphingomonas kaistensis]
MTEAAASVPEDQAAPRSSVPVWDLPIRLVHWTIALLVAFSWWSAENGEIEWHIRSGLTILFLLLFRLLWGVLGSSTARFGSFVAGPSRVAAYLRDPAGWSRVGHTPLGALSVVALLALLVLQVAFGLPLSDEDGIVTGPLNRLVSFDTAEWAHEVHEILFNILLAFIALHVAAIVYYRWKGRHLVSAMVTGDSKDYPAGTQGLVRAGAGRLVVSLAIAAAVTWWIANGVPGL